MRHPRRPEPCPRPRSSRKEMRPSLAPKTQNMLFSAIVLTVALTGCDSSDTGLSYPAPDNICGIPADRALLESLLDDGDEFEQDPGFFDLEDGQFCHMYVDGNESVVSDGEWHESGYTLRDHFESYDVSGLRYFAAGKYASWDSGVATVIPCPGVSEEGEVVSVEINDMEWNEESQSTLEKFVPEYFDAYKKKLGCRS